MPQLIYLIFIHFVKYGVLVGVNRKSALNELSKLELYGFPLFFGITLSPPTTPSPQLRVTSAPPCPLYLLSTHLNQQAASNVPKDG